MLYLFDIDGTLLLSGGAGKRALERVFLERYGLAAGMHGINPAGMTDPSIVEAMLAKVKRAAAIEEVGAVLRDYEAALADEITRSPKYRLMNGAREILAHL